MRALVTGANGEIGSEIIQSLMTQGYSITALDKQFDNVSNHLKFCPEVNYVLADFSDPRELSRLMESWDEPFDVFVHAAGVREIESVLSLSLETWQSVIHINMSSAFILAQQLSKNAINCQMPLCIIFISSISGLQGEPNRSAYCASKHGMIGMAKAMAIELAEHGVRVNVIAPGIIETALTRVYQQSAAVMSQLEQNIPLKKWGKPTHIAQTVDYIIQNDYVTGSVVVVDGGWMAGKRI